MLAVFLLFCSYNALALDFDIGTGITNYSKPQNGIYYQKGYPYSLDLQASTLSVGVSFKRHDLRYEAEFVSLGQAHTICVAEADATYNGYPHNGSHLYRLIGNGNITGGLFSVSKESYLPIGSLYGKVGLFVYKQMWKVEFSDIDGNYLGTETHSTQLEVRPMLGLGYRVGNLDFGISYFKIDSHKDGLPFVSSDAYVFETKVSF